MATKLVRTCDRKGCEIESVDSIADVSELKSSPTVGYTILKFETDAEGVTTSEIMVDLDEVCGDCSTEVEALVASIRADAAAPVVEKAVEAAPVEEKPKKRRGRPPGSKNKKKVEPATPAETAELKQEVKGALKDSLEKALNKAEESAPATEKEPEPAKAAEKDAPVEEAKAAEAQNPDPVEPPETFVTEGGDVVNAETGEVIASKTSEAASGSVETKDEDVKPAVSAPTSAEPEPAHPF